MAKKELYKVEKCYYTDSANYNKYVLKGCWKDIVVFDTEPTEEQITAAIQEWKDSVLNDTVEVHGNEIGKYITINILDIREFGISNTKQYTRKGNFSTWWKRHYARTNDGKLHWMHETDFDMLKERLEGKYSKEKYTHSVYKNYTEKKTTDWTYTITA